MTTRYGNYDLKRQEPYWLEGRPNQRYFATTRERPADRFEHRQASGFASLGDAPPLAGSDRPVATGDRRDTDRIHTKIVVPFVQISNSTSVAKSKPVSETRISSLKDGIWSNDSEDRSRYTITNMSSRSGHQSPDLPALIARIFPSVNQPISIIAIWDFDKIPIVKMPHSGPLCSDKIRRPNGPCPRLFFSGGAAKRPVRSLRFPVVRSD